MLGAKQISDLLEDNGMIKGILMKTPHHSLQWIANPLHSIAATEAGR